MKKNNYNNWYSRQPGTQQPGADNRPPWMMHPKKRGIPKFARKLLTVLIIAGLIVLGIYIYYTLNPSVGRLVKF